MRRERRADLIQYWPLANASEVGCPVFWVLSEPKQAKNRVDRVQHGLEDGGDLPREGHWWHHAVADADVLLECLRRARVVEVVARVGSINRVQAGQERRG